MSNLDGALSETLEYVALKLLFARDPWWVIGGAAAALHGVAPQDVNDVDILLSSRDAQAVLSGVGTELSPGSYHPRFRSDLIAKCDEAPLSIELMCGFSYRSKGDWVSVKPATRRGVSLGTGTVYTPERDELRSMMEGFGRPKDLHRARMLVST